MPDATGPFGTTQTGMPQETTRSSSDESQYRTDPAEQKTQKAGDKAKETAAKAGERVKQASKDAGDAIAGGATQAASSARRKAREFAHSQKQRLAGEIGACCSALHDAAEKYNEESATKLGSYANAAADGLNRAKTYLENHDLERMLDDAERTVRNHRELAYGACFVAGLGLARFLKASARSRPTTSDAYSPESGRDRGQSPATTTAAARPPQPVKRDESPQSRAEAASSGAAPPSPSSTSQGG